MTVLLMPLAIAALLALLAVHDRIVDPPASPARRADDDGPAPHDRRPLTPIGGRR